MKFSGIYIETTLLSINYSVQDWSPCGKYLAVGIYNNDYLIMYFCNKILTKCHTLHNCLYISWSPCSRYLACLNYSSDNGSDVCISISTFSNISIDLVSRTDNIKLVYHNRIIWSPCGNYIALENRILSVKESYKTIHTLISGYISDNISVWSPCGRYFAYVSSIAYGINILNVKDKFNILYTLSMYNIWDPLAMNIWSPCGNYFIYAAHKGIYNEKIYTIIQIWSINKNQILKKFLL